MPTSLNDLSNLDWVLIAGVGLLLLVCGGLALRLQQTDAIAISDAEDSAADGSNDDSLEQDELLQTAQAELKEAREEAELTLLQLHQVQEELEQVFLQKQARESEVNELKQQLRAREREPKSAQQSNSAVGNQQLATPQADLKEAREEAELTLLQLHQVQEELEHYFLLSREQSSLLDAHAEQQKRVQKLLKVALQTRSASELSGVS